MTRNTSRTKSATRRSVLSMSAAHARAFFLKPESYFRTELPPYFNLGAVLQATDRYLLKNPLKIKKASGPRDCDDVNYTLFSNKDGRLAWRAFQLVHPALYVAIVHAITDAVAWKTIMDSFKAFQADPRISCHSLPADSLTRTKDQGAQILQWWEGVEQQSIELALDYDFVLSADIADCYPSIYTHSIAWAIHGKAVAKTKRRDQSLIGNTIDSRIQDMQHGQTNGVPQGSVLFDLVAELVLGYADLLLSKLLQDGRFGGIRILRYRDDYRIFVNDTQLGEEVLKILAEVLLGLGLKLSTSKTTVAKPVIESSVKRDKLAWLHAVRWDKNLHKHLLLIHCHGVAFPNSGSLVRALSDIQQRIDRLAFMASPGPQISILADIGIHSPKCFPLCAAIISKILSLVLRKAERRKYLDRVLNKLRKVPHNGHLEVWMQRISYTLDKKVAYDERLCKAVCGDSTIIWNSSWIDDPVLAGEIDTCSVVDVGRLRKLRPVVARSEVGVFDY